jgi:hypothetical protein
VRMVSMPPEGIHRAGRWDDVDQFPQPEPPIGLAVASPLLDGPRWEDLASRFATVKCSRSAEAAIGRIIARYRPRVVPPGPSIVQEVEGEQVVSAREEYCGIVDVLKRFLTHPPDHEGEPALVVGEVPPDVLDDLYVLHIPFDRAVSFVDIDHHSTREALNSVFGGTLELLGMRSLDGNNLAREPDRRLTRLVLGTLYDLCARGNYGNVAGIRIGGQPDEPWESFVYWSNPAHVDLTADDIALRWVAPWDDDLIAAATRLNLRLPDSR